MTWIDLGVGLCGLPPLGASMYLAALAILSRRPSIPPATAPHLKFVIVVPAHDEEGGIARTVESLKAIDYPPEFFHVLVVADNCHDRTAERAAAAGADVLVRCEPRQRGKGYALARAFDDILAEDFADAIVVVDADTLVSRNLLKAFASRFETGAVAVQAEYGVQNALSSWRTRLMTIALAAFHDVRSLGRERLGLSCGLRGNGMGFSREVLRAKPYGAFSIVEDLEYGLELGFAGFRVTYIGEARVLGEMVTTERASRSQRRRWEHGRTVLTRQYLPRLLKEAWRRRDGCLLDLALDLLVPPLAQLAAVTAVGSALALATLWTLGRADVALSIWGATSLGLCAYVVRGWFLSGVGARGLLDLLRAPGYVLWKLALLFARKDAKPDEWIRTGREVKM